MINISGIFKSLIRRLSPSGQDPRKFLQLVSESSLFNRDWYLARYPDVRDAGMDPALHYLMYGTHEGRDPGPHFGTSSYLKRNPDVALSGINPLVHYILHGKAEGRKTTASKYFEKYVKKEAPDPAVIPCSFPVAVPSGIAWVRHGDIGINDHPAVLQFAGTVLGKLPIDVTEEGLRKILLPIVPVISDYCSLLDPGLFNTLQISGGAISSAVLNSGPGSHSHDSEMIARSATGFVLEDIWYKNDYVLRLRIGPATEAHPSCSVIRLYCWQGLSEAPLRMCAESLYSGQGLLFIDAVLENPYFPLLMSSSSPDGDLQSLCMLPFPSLCRGGVHYAELFPLGPKTTYPDKLQQFAAVLLEQMLNDTDGSPGLSLASISVDIDGATGAEIIFSADLRRWLARVMRIRLAPADLSVVSGTNSTRYLQNLLASVPDGVDEPVNRRITARAGRGTIDLTIPYDAVPTLSLLVSRHRVIASDSTVMAGTFILADRSTMTPAWLVSLPPLGQGLIDVQPLRTVIGFPVCRLLRDYSNGGRVTDPLPGTPAAIRYRKTTGHDDAGYIMPVAPDIRSALIRGNQDCIPVTGPGITVILRLHNPHRAEIVALLESLHLQTSAHVLDIIAITTGSGSKQQSEIRNILQAKFAGRFMLFTTGGAGQIQSALGNARGKFLLFIDPGVVLHDPRTLEVLSQIANGDNVASASCFLISEHVTEHARSIRFHSGGVILSQAVTGETVYSRLDMAAWLSPLTYPVAENSPLLQMTRKDIWSRLYPHGSADIRNWHHNLETGSQSVGPGFVHYCTTVVSAGLSAVDDTDGRIADEALGNMPLDMDALSTRTTILRELQA